MKYRRTQGFSKFPKLLQGVSRGKVLAIKRQFLQGARGGGGTEAEGLKLLREEDT